MADNQSDSNFFIKVTDEPKFVPPLPRTLANYFLVGVVRHLLLKRVLHGDLHPDLSVGHRDNLVVDYARQVDVLVNTALQFKCYRRDAEVRGQ